MKTSGKTKLSADQPAFKTLLAACKKLRFEPHDIARQLDKQGRYEVPLDKEFPFHLTLFHFQSGRYTPTWNWHERLELTMPLDGQVRMRMGEDTVELAPGDLLVVDNLKLHNVQDFPGFDTRVIVMSFMPEFVYTPGSPACDYAFLLPFYTKREGHPHILRATDDLSSPVYIALTELLRRYFETPNTPHSQSGCKASFLQILYSLILRFQEAEVLRSEFVQHRQQADRLARLFEYVRLNYAERITVEQATQLVHMSQAQFMKVFKKVSGMTFVAHVTRVRITQALRLLRETNLTIADIAAQTGFSDQSYFDRRFRQAFGKSPREWRHETFQKHATSTRRGPVSHG
jgi:AraC-like DNA-binding protein